MSIAANLPVLIAQTPIMGTIAHAEQSHPEVQQSLAQQQAAAENTKAHEEVQGNEPTETGNLKVREDNGRKPGQQHAGPHGRKRHAAAPEAEDEESPPASSPWSGNIVDVKI
ncbi:MAG: hypothetical protein AB7E47_11990 [Desulfovibrionaceae bacterium]